MSWVYDSHMYDGRSVLGGWEGESHLLSCVICILDMQTNHLDSGITDGGDEEWRSSDGYTKGKGVKATAHQGGWRALHTAGRREKRKADDAFVFCFFLSFQRTVGEMFPKRICRAKRTKTWAWMGY